MIFKLRQQIKLSLALLMTMTIAGSCTAATNPTTVKTQYQNSSENFANPERGFYQSVDPIDDNPELPLALSDLQKVRSNNMSTIRRYYLLSQFRDKQISQSYLDMITNDCKNLRKAGLKMVVRFTYNWMGGGPDAPGNIILSHLDQLQPIFKANYDVIAYVEAGFIGDWGEWHHSRNNLVDQETGVISSDGKKIFFKLLSALPKQRMVALRTHGYKQELFNNQNSLTPAEAFNTSDRARTGYHNDAFRSTLYDWGTYSYGNQDVMEQEKSWLNLDTRYVVQGGEPARGDSDPPEWDDCPGALSDFARMHWSGMSMNQPDSGPLYQQWRDQGCMGEIQRRLGYRFRLIDSNIPDKVKPAGTFSMSFRVVNDGWASPYNPRNLEVVLRNKNTGKQYYLPVPESVRMWMPGETKTVNIVGGIPADMPAGEYQVLLNLPDPTSNLYNRSPYSIRLANQNVWEASTGYNSLQRSIFVDSSATGESYSGSQLFKAR